jgi:Cu+-exporting ATPase
LSVTRKLERRSPGEERVSISQIVVGDRLILRNGELIPADARLIDGPALIDYSFVTGESEPVEKKPGDYLYAGGRQIGGAIEVEMAKAVSQSYLTSLWNQDAFRKDKADTLDNLTNRYSQRFTKLVIAIALGSAAYWAFADSTRAVKAFTSVLIVACPCALALAAPFALGTAVRLLGRRKIFLKNAHVVETLARVDAVVFDKTGTLTAAGAGSVTWHGTALYEAEARWLYSMTRHSTHPLAVRVGEAIAARAHFPDLVRSFHETAGCGMEGSVAGNEIWMGSAAWLESRGARLGLQDQSRHVSRNGSVAADSPHTAAAQGSAIHAAINGQYRGCFILASALRPQADKLIDDLSGDYELALLSGDHAKEREQFAGVFREGAHLHFNQSPLNKLDFIRGLQESGRTVMMVGDGLNDAGALQQSDVGVAVVENVSSFSPASDVIAASSAMPQLGAVLRFAKDTALVVRVAFLVSAAYNVIGIAIAASGRLSPVVCAVLMPLSSITVVAFACGATTWAARRGGQGKTFAKDVESRLPHLDYERGPA